jgi:hypothetical protein
MTEEEKVLITNDLLSRFPAYGEFDLVLIKKPIVITNTTEAREVIKTWEQTAAEALQEGARFIKEQQIIQELIFGGFVINRHDIKAEGKIYRQLTDRGRELKEMGSMEAFNLYVESRNRRKRLQDQRTERLYWINFWIAVGAISAALYYILEILRIQYHLGLPNHVFFQ